MEFEEPGLEARFAEPNLPTYQLVVPHEKSSPGFIADFVNRASVHGLLVRSQVLTHRDPVTEEEVPIGLRAVAW